LSKGVREDKLGADNQDLGNQLWPVPVGRLAYLWCETLEERAHSLLLDHLLDDGNTSDLRVEVGVLDTCLDDIQGSSDSDGSDGTGDRSNKV
jgi:hypothetical protein